MSTIISTTTYKNYQIVIVETTVNQYEYKVDNPVNQNTIKHNHGYSNPTDATNAAQATIDALAVNQAEPTIAAVLSGNNTLANSVITALINAGYNIVLDPHRDCDD
jgi:hypothetical protein